VLEPDRPVYLIRTLFGMAGKSDAMTETLADLLAPDILEVLGDAPLRFIGFCEGAKLAHFLAERLAAAQKPADVIVSIDYDWPRLWSGPVLHAQSDDYAAFRRPELGLGLRTPAGCEVMRLAGAHESVLEGPSMPALGARINAVLDNPSALAVPAPLVPPGTLGPQSAGLRLEMARLVPSGGTAAARIHLHNRSAETLEPTEQSGLALCVDLVNFDGHVRQRVAGFAALDAALAPGETLTAELDITIPQTRTPMRACAYLTQEGLRRIAGHTPRAARRVLLPFRG